MALFALTYHYCSDAELVAAHRPEHRAYLASLYESGALLAAGPVGEPGPPRGLLILQVPSEDQAHAVAADDPFTARGVIDRYELGAWTPSFGADRFDGVRSDSSS